MIPSQTISHARTALRFAARRRQLTTDHARGTFAHDQDERAARIARYAEQVARYEQRTGQSWLNGRRRGSSSRVPRTVRAVSFEGVELARFVSVRDAARYVRACGLSRSPVASIASTLRKGIRRGHVNYGIRLLPIAA